MEYGLREMKEEENLFVVDAGPHHLRQQQKEFIYKFDFSNQVIEPPKPSKFSLSLEGNNNFYIDYGLTIGTYPIDPNKSWVEYFGMIFPLEECLKFYADKKGWTCTPEAMKRFSLLNNDKKRKNENNENLINNKKNKI